MRSLRTWIDTLEQQGELHRVSAEVDWDEELTAITYMRAQEPDSPALLFENVEGYDNRRVLSNILSTSLNRIGHTFNIDTFDTELDLIRQLREAYSKTIPPETVTDGPVLENTKTGNDIDLYEFPAPKMWPKDGGRYLGTANYTIMRHPEKEWLNTAVYRGMIQGDGRVGLYVSPGKDAREIIDYWWDRGEPCEVAVSYGSDPLPFAMSAMSYGSGTSELDYIGGMYGEPVELVDGRKTDIPFPASAEIVIEGHLEPGETMPEGPFGEFQGYYGRPEDDAYVIDVDAVHHRDDPILTAALMADYPGCEQNLFLGLNKAAQTWDELETVGVSGVEGVYCPPSAHGGFGFTVVSIDQQQPGHARQVAGLVAEFPTSGYINKYIVVVDDDVDPTDMDDVLWAMTTRTDPERDFNFHTDTWSTWLDPAKNPPEERPWGSRVLINATIPSKDYEEFSERTRVGADVYERACDRWEEYGFDDEPPTLRALLDPAERGDGLRHVSEAAKQSDSDSAGDGSGAWM